MKTLVISPTYNERKNIKLLVNMVLGNSPEFDLLIVDDNSPDGTSEKVKELQSQFKNLHLKIKPSPIKAHVGQKCHLLPKKRLPFS